jgi:hypothetical protein
MSHPPITSAHPSPRPINPSLHAPSVSQSGPRCRHQNYRCPTFLERKGYIHWPTTLELHLRPELAPSSRHQNRRSIIQPGYLWLIFLHRTARPLPYFSIPHQTPFLEMLPPRTNTPKHDTILIAAYIVPGVLVALTFAVVVYGWMARYRLRRVMRR